MVLKLAQIVGLPTEQPLVINILFASDIKMAKLNQKFLGHNGPTDVITFSYFDDETLVPDDVIVDLAIGAEVADRIAKTIPDTGRARELALYVVHGLLHAVGEDDLTTSARKRMRQRERAVMTLLEQHFNFAEVFPENIEQ